MCFSRFCGFMHSLSRTYVPGLFVPSDSIMKVRTRDFPLENCQPQLGPLYTNIDAIIVIASYVFLNSYQVFYLTFYYEESGDYMLPDWVRQHFLHSTSLESQNVSTYNLTSKSVFLPRKSLQLIHELSISCYLLSPTQSIHVPWSNVLSVTLESGCKTIRARDLVCFIQCPITIQ